MVKVVLVPPPEISLYQVLKCPECKSTTVLIEKIEGSETRITLKLELPPGADLPLLALRIHLIDRPPRFARCLDRQDAARRASPTVPQSPESQACLLSV